MKAIAERIFRETIAALDIRAVFQRKVLREGSMARIGGMEIDLSRYREIVAIAFGKAAVPMAEALAGHLAPDFSCDGIVAAPVAPPRALRGWRTFVGGHPVPNEQSFAAGRTILERLAHCDERSLIFFLLSGGGSSLVESPLLPDMALSDFQALNALLVGCGAPIEEINIVRKHVSAEKGGRLAAAAPRSMKVTLAISDVPPGQETALASGPTLPDPTTLDDARRVIRRYELKEKLPVSVHRAFEHDRALPETPKHGDAAFDRSHFSLLLGSHDLTHAAHRACESLGYECICDAETDGWPLEKAADRLLAMLAQQQSACNGRRAAVVASGEVSSRVTGNGVGGRNSAFVLACVPRVVGRKITVLSCGTDGIDGNSPAAGAIADGDSATRGAAAGLDPADFARRSDAYHFFENLGDVIVTGPTGNNLRDLRILLAEPHAT